MFNHQILIAMEIPLHVNYTSFEAVAWPRWGLCYCQIAVWGRVFFFFFFLEKQRQFMSAWTEMSNMNMMVEQG
jgi:hypothetical protein